MALAVGARLAGIQNARNKKQEPDNQKEPGKGAGGRARRIQRPGAGGAGGLPDDTRRKSKLDRDDDGTYQASGSANIILYVGLGMICIGLVITFVGLGDKGFRTLELKLIGPSLVGCGLFFALLRVLFCTVPSCCRAMCPCCKCCRKDEETEELIYATDDPLSKTGYVGGNGTNISAGGSTDQRKVGPTTITLGKNVRKRSGGKTTNQASEEESDQDGGGSGGGEFHKKAITIRTTKPSIDTEKSGAGSSGGGAKPISYDTYSTDTSSQFSVDIVEVAPRGLEMENKNEVQIENGPQTEGDGIVLNASKLQVETEK